MLVLENYNCTDIVLAIFKSYLSLLE